MEAEPSLIGPWEGAWVSFLLSGGKESVRKLILDSPQPVPVLPSNSTSTPSGRQITQLSLGTQDSSQCGNLQVPEARCLTQRSISIDTPHPHPTHPPVSFRLPHL